MEYVVYCDESRHEGPGHHTYMSIGGLWVPRSEKIGLTRQFRALCRSLNLRSEIKWNKVSATRLEAYKRLVDFFFEHESLLFRVIVVNRTKVNVEKYHGGDWELGFYKFYYEMLEKWITKGNQYLILVDFQQNKGANRYSDLRSALEQTAKGKAEIKDLTVIDSRYTPLSQLCDLLTGSVSASWCGLTERTPKAELAAYIAKKCGYTSLTVQSSSPDICKFNIFHIQLE
jgi:hypothetical protein